MKPYVIVEWNDTETEAHGWLCVYNLVKGFAGGGIRMHPTVTKEEVVRLAEKMGYKYNAAETPDCGGCKAGIVYDAKAPDAYEVLKRFMAAVRPYADLGLALGCDLGTKSDDIYKIRADLGMRQVPATKSQAQDPVCIKGRKEMMRLMGEKVDVFALNDAITGYGVAFAADEAWKFKNGNADGARVVIQGFGCVGASCAYKLKEMGYKIVGIADAKQLVTCEDGLDVEELLKHKNAYGEMDPEFFPENYAVRANSEWMDVPCEILIPAALEDVINEKTVGKLNAPLLVEAANIPVSDKADEILREKNIMMVPDFIANVGAIRFFAHCRLCMIEFTPEGVISDIEKNVRGNTRFLFEEHEATGKYIRDIAHEKFAPTVQSQFEF